MTKYQPPLNFLSYCISVPLQAFKALFTEELKELSASPFGSTLVGTIGLVYYEAASSELSTVDGLSVGFAQASRSVSTGMYT